MLFPFHVLHRHQIIGKEPIGLDQCLRSQLQGRVRKPVANAQKIIELVQAQGYSFEALDKDDVLARVA